MKNTKSNTKSAGICFAWVEPEKKAGICFAWVSQEGSNAAMSRPTVVLNLESLN